MADINPKSVNDVFSVKLRARKRNGQWMPPKMIFSVVTEVKYDEETNEATMKVADIFINLAQASEINQVRETGIGPRIAPPAFLKKYDPQKMGVVVRRAREKTDETDRDGKPITREVGTAFTKLADGHRIPASFEDADRAELRLFAAFGQVKSPLDIRVGMVEDQTADGGWRPASEWTSQFTCPTVININGTPVVMDAKVVHQTYALLSNRDILLDRKADIIQPQAPAAELGDCI